MRQLSGHRPGWPSTPGPWSGAHSAGSDVQSPIIACRHDDSSCACARTSFSSTPHLQAAHCRICGVVPVYRPSTLDAMSAAARGSLLTGSNTSAGSTRLPVVALYTALAGTGSGTSATRAAQASPVGRAEPGGSVPNVGGGLGGSGAGADGPGSGATVVPADVAEVRSTATAAVRTTARRRVGGALVTTTSPEPTLT